MLIAGKDCRKVCCSDRLFSKLFPFFPGFIEVSVLVTRFQSTHPRRGHECIDRPVIVPVHDFNPRAYKRRDFPYSYHQQNQTTFQSTRLQEARQIHSNYASAPTPVSIHAPIRGATDYVKKLHALPDISIHAPARGATGPCEFGLEELRFQSTRLQEARRMGKKYLKTTVYISIHAPARGATANG